MNEHVHNEQYNAAHEMDAGGKWETINQLGVALMIVIGSLIR